ncbi:MAG TPA: transketolase [Bacteroidales bacterium]|nr:transketolase [Bacteroidales bacterium]HPS62436.1 transketolase [Bacteroidales bacterium]
MFERRTTDPVRLQALAREIRKSVIRSLTAAGSGHLGGSLGLADIFTALYFSFLNHDPDKPGWSDRDRLILSIGHVAPVLYATLSHCGYFPVEELLTLRKLGSRLQGHPGRDHGLPGLELSAGSLGQGLSVATGMALAAKLDGRSNRVVTILGDGELQEGSVWEAAMAASHHNLGNLLAIVDRNGVQIDGDTEKVMALEPLEAKWQSFGWHVLSCNGHDFNEILDAFHKAGEWRSSPAVILAHTQMGKGIPSIEGDYRWHGKAPSPEQAAGFLQILSS